MPNQGAAWGYSARELAALAGYHLHPVESGGVREREVLLAGTVPVRFLEYGPEVGESEIVALVRRSGRLPDIARHAAAPRKPRSRK